MVSRRVIRSYQARYGMGANKASMYDLTDAIDVHAHARGQDEEEPLHAAQQATRAGMNAILFKSISPGRPWEVAKKLQDDVDRWAEKEHLRPAKCWSAWVIGIPLKPIDFAEIKAAVEGGITGMWMPPVTSAWSMFRRGDAGAHGRAVHQGPPAAGARGLAGRGAGQGRDHASRPGQRRALRRRALRHAARPDAPRRDDVCLADQRGPRRAVVHHPAHEAGAGAAADDDAALGAGDVWHGRPLAGLHERHVRGLERGRRVLRAGPARVRSQHPALLRA